jgi:hypothetical protein
VAFRGPTRAINAGRLAHNEGGLGLASYAGPDHSPDVQSESSVGAYLASYPILLRSSPWRVQAQRVAAPLIGGTPRSTSLLLL